MNKFAKAALFSAVLFMTAEAAFAQITLDLDVLTEDFLPKESVSSSTQTTKEIIPLTAPKTAKKKKTVKPKPPQKPATVKPATKKTTPAVAAVKPVVKKPEPAKKEKFQIKEAAKKDEHDKLKPRANPVPDVKVLAVETSVRQAEIPAIEEEEIEAPAVVTEPKISKHFLEQERLKAKEAQKIKEEILQPETPEKTAEEKSESEKPQQDSPQKDPLPEPEPVREPPMILTPKTLLSAIPKQAEKTEKKTTKDQPQQQKFSVFPVLGKLTPAERSALLAREIPLDSATHKALEKNNELIQIFVFDDKSSSLTSDMKSALDGVTEMLKKEKEKRLILYSYGAPDPTEPEKERQYALRRALEIRSYLIGKGINSLRIEMRSQGQKGAGTKMPNRTDILTRNR